MCKKNKNRQTSTTSTPQAQRSFRQAVDAVDLRRFNDLDLTPLPKGAKATGTLGKSLKRVFLLRYDAEQKAERIFGKAAELHQEHLQHHLNHATDQGPGPNCAEHNAELRPLKERYEAAKREFRRLDEVFRGTLGFEFDFKGNGKIEVFQGGKFTFTPAGVQDADLKGLPPELAGLIKEIVADFPGKVSVERIDGSNASHVEIEELLHALERDGSPDSRGSNAKKPSDGRPRRSYFGEQAAANVAANSRK